MNSLKSTKGNNVYAYAQGAPNRNSTVIPETNSFFIIKTDLQGKFTYINPFFCANFGLDESGFEEQFLIDQIIPEDHQAYRDTLQNCLAEAGKSHWVSLRENSDASVISTYWEFKVVQHEPDQPQEVLGIGHDITGVMEQQKLKDLVDVTEEENKKLINFTYVISHNIRSHVANINGIIDLNETGTEEEREMSWEIIKKCMLRLGATINNLNDIINIQTHHDLPEKRLNLMMVIKRMITSVNMLFDQENTIINYHFDESVFLETNPAYLESIILNLFTNAVKYRSSERSLQIDLSLVEKDGFKILLFKDNGLGIDLTAYGDKIFGMYKTFHGNADAKGMGLYIIKTQIEALGGSIDVESVVGESTTFKVYFK